MNSWRSLNIHKIRPLTMGFDFVHFQSADIGIPWPEKKTIALSPENYSKYFIVTLLAGSQVSDHCPLGYLLCIVFDKCLNTL